MRSLVFIFSIMVLFSCSTAIADQDKKENELDNKNVVAKDDDFAAIMLRSQKTGTFASNAVTKADKAVVDKIEVTVQKIDKLEDKIEDQSQKIETAIRAIKQREIRPQKEGESNKDYENNIDIIIKLNLYTYKYNK